MIVGSPKEVAGYDSMVAKGINVYVPKKSVIDPEGIKISMAGWFQQGLKIKGLIKL